MATQYPAGIDSFVNPLGSDFQDNPTKLHDQQHSNVNDAVEALEAKVGINSTGDTNSHDYKITNLTSLLASKQPLDADLTTIAALSPVNDSIIQRKGGVWTGRTLDQLKTDLEALGLIGGGGAPDNEVVISATQPTFTGGEPEIWIDTASSGTGGGGASLTALHSALPGYKIWDATSSSYIWSGDGTAPDAAAWTNIIFIDPLGTHDPASSPGGRVHANDLWETGTGASGTGGSGSSVVGSQTFTYTGASQSFVVPTGVTVIQVTMFGAAGGIGWYNGSVGAIGGYGARITGPLLVTPGETLQINVGGQPAPSNSTNYLPGFNGGGNGFFASTGRAGGGGGGASDVRQGGTALANRVVVAAGGGGGATQAGGSGGLVGSNGAGGAYAGFGGSSGGGGAAGTPGGATAGVLGVGGNGGSGGSPYVGGGGGGGLYGGGGGGGIDTPVWNGFGGGGGSSLMPGGGTAATGASTGNGSVYFAWGPGAGTGTGGVADLVGNKLYLYANYK